LRALPTYGRSLIRWGLGNGILRLWHRERLGLRE